MDSGSRLAELLWSLKIALLQLAACLSTGTPQPALYSALPIYSVLEYGEPRSRVKASGLVPSLHTCEAQAEGAIVYYTSEFIFYFLPI